MDASFDAGALGELGHEQKALLDTIDGLRGLGVEPDALPQIIVVGDKSSGKSSVLEAISRIPFPVKSGLCTRSPTELVLRTAPELKFTVRVRSKGGERDAPFNKERLTKDDLPAIIEEAKEEMGIGVGAKDFSDETLHIEISGPDLPHLTLVDLPGLYRTATKDESDEGIEMVQKLAKKYMKQKNTIILAVISASSDVALQEVLALAKTYDPNRERTMGVITKPDALEPASPEEGAFIRLVQNEDPIHTLKLGWHILRNRSSSENDENNSGLSKTSDEKRDEKEREFLGSGSWASIPVSDRGVEPLRQKLSTALTKHIKSSLPGLIGTMEKKLKAHQEALAKLGVSRTTDSERRQFIFNIAHQYREISYAATHGLYDGKFFRGADHSLQAGSLVRCDERRLRAVVRNLNCAFDYIMSTKGARRNIQFPVLGIDEPEYVTSESLKPWVALFNSTTDTTIVSWQSVEKELEAAAANNRGNQFPGSPNDGLALELFRDQAQKWHGIASKYIGLVLKAVKLFVQLALEHILGPNKVTKDALYNNYVDRFFEERQLDLDMKLEELIRHYQEGDILCLEDEFQRRIAKRNRLHLATHIGHMLPNKLPSTSVFTEFEVIQAVRDTSTDRMDRFGLERVVGMMDAYYQMSLRTFTDNVIILAVENCLMSKVPDLLKAVIEKDMDQATLELLANEPRLVNQERKRLDMQVTALKDGLRIFEKNRPLMGSLLPRETVTPKKADNKSKKDNIEVSSSSRSRDTSTSNIGIPSTLDTVAYSPAKMSSTTSNPAPGGLFGARSEPSVQTSPRGGVFGSGNKTAATTSSTSLFSSGGTKTAWTTPSTGPFSSGGIINAWTTPSTGLFSGGGNKTAATAPSTGGGLFGSGNKTAATTPSTGGGLFGGGNNTAATTPSTSGGLFGGGNKTATTTPSTGSLFGGGGSSSTTSTSTSGMG
ncbi:hypothetical protein QQS21_009873 [Conoideocrella luteorostrata]|uniref:P-loop containing nucleoside triphosphate hydrolase protein n=1 Tax=Conoideocrella luteorostrata TaxID=1105319 RepID=A0AAJ0FPX7_9HYPO|nr:hypothetical protein QQS21_009873 [Conoideocrella luteorostrata]